MKDKDQRIKELESSILELQSELARKKMSLTVACNRVEELEDKLKIAVADVAAAVAYAAAAYAVADVADVKQDIIDKALELLRVSK